MNVSMQEVRDLQGELRGRVTESPEFRWLRPFSIWLPFYSQHRRWVLALTALVGVLLVLVHQGRWLAGPVTVLFALRILACATAFPRSRAAIARGLIWFWLLVAVLIELFRVNPVLATASAALTPPVLALSVMLGGAGYIAVAGAFVRWPLLDDGEARRAVSTFEYARATPVEQMLRLLLVMQLLVITWVGLLTLVLGLSS